MFYLRKIFPISRFVIDENSMLPVYKPGDRVLTFNWGPVNAGDVVVFRENKTNYIKRVDSTRGGFVYLSSDNRGKATKIWKIAKRQIVGLVLLKY